MPHARPDARPAHRDAPTITPAVQRRLGALLGAAYERNALSTPLPERAFDDLLARLERAFEQLGIRNEEAFRTEFLTMAPRLQKFAMSLTKNPTLADDLVQDTLLRAWRSRTRFETGTNLGAWLFTIMRNAFYSAHRKGAREVTDNDVDYAERLATVPEQAGHLDLQDAQAALEKLPEPMRQALVLVAIDNLSYEEAATVMRCQIGTVKSRVWRAREQLAILLGYGASEVGADCTTLSAMNLESRFTG